MSEESNETPNPETCGHECSGCASASSCSSRAPEKLKPNAVSSIDHVVGIVSGKGGVGKTLATCLLASELHKKGMSVGILDADVTGPSIPKSFGVKGPLRGTETGINPGMSKEGIEIVSTNLMLPEEDMAVAWRGPVLSGIINQFFSEVNWGHLDYLLVDMPPGTSDAFLTVFQSLPVEKIITVSTPQELVAMIVGKAVNLAGEMNIPVVGLIENMSYYLCPHCGERLGIYGDSKAEEVARRYDIPTWATLPIDTQFAQLVDAGDIVSYELDGALDSIIEAI